MEKKSLCILVVALLVTAIMVGPTVSAVGNVGGYSDVSVRHWAYGSITSCTQKGLMSGVGGDRFSPESNLTRAQVCQVLYNAYSTVLPHDGKHAQKVDGMTGQERYAEALQWAVDHALLCDTYHDMYMSGVVYGANPDSVATRQFVAVALYRLAGRLDVALPTTSPATGFSDSSDLDDIYQEAIMALQRAGVIEGFPDGTYKPESSLTRAQAAVIFDRITDIDGMELRNYH